MRNSGRLLIWSYDERDNGLSAVLEAGCFDPGCYGGVWARNCDSRIRTKVCSFFFACNKLSDSVTILVEKQLVLVVSL